MKFSIFYLEACVISGTGPITQSWPEIGIE
jgi:hypothetical protein